MILKYLIFSNINTFLCNSVLFSEGKQKFWNTQHLFIWNILDCPICQIKQQHRFLFTYKRHLSAGGESVTFNIMGKCGLGFQIAVTAN